MKNYIMRVSDQIQSRVYRKVVRAVRSQLKYEDKIEPCVRETIGRTGLLLPHYRLTTHLT